MTELIPLQAALDVLLELTTAIGRASSFEAVYEAGLDAIERGLDVTRASILLFDPDRVMRFKAWRGLSDRYRSAVEGHTPWTPDNTDAVPLFVPDVNADSSLAPHLATIRAEGIAAMAFVPLITDRAVVGKFMVYYPQPHQATQTELRLATVIAAQVAFGVQRLRAEHVDRARERQLMVVTDAAPVGIAHIDSQRRFKFVNRTYATQVGLPLQSVLGKTMAEVLGAAAYESIREYVDAALAGERCQADVAGQVGDVVPRMMRLLCVPELDGAGAVCGIVAVAVDVTDRHDAELSERAAEAYLRAVIDSTPECVKVVAEDGTLVEMNAAGLQMVEASSAEAVAGQCVYDLIAPEHRDRFRAFNERVCRGERGALEFEIIGLAGTRRRMETHAVPLMGRDGSTRQLAITRDITQRHLADVALRDSEALFRQLADAVPQIIWMTGPTGVAQYYNQRWYEFTGTNPGDQAGPEVVHVDDRGAILEAWQRSLATGDVYSVELRLREAVTGRYRWHLARAVPVHDEQGTLVRWVGASTNIDEQKRAERTSRFIAEASRMMATLVDYNTALERVAHLAVPDFADWCAVDMVDGPGTLRRLALCHSDPAKIELAFDLERRYPPRRDAPHGVYEVLRTGQSELMSEISDDLLARAAYDADHLEAIRTLGLRSYIAVPLRAGGRPVGVVTFIATDDSGRRYEAQDLTIAEELAHRASIAIENARLYSELQEAARQKDEFLAVLAHELRNPLAPIRTALQLVQVAGDDAARRTRACSVMDRQLHQLVRLVDDLLDVSRITRGLIELQKQPSELATMLQNAIETSRPTIEMNAHELTVTFPREPITIDADATRIAQVFSNLLNNAAKYTPRGGHISVSAEFDGEAATICVRDTGIGIPPEMLTRVFEMFVQVDRSFEKTSGGLGIGLTLVKRLVEMHGGTVQARSAGTGTGSEFVVCLPARVGTRSLGDERSEPMASMATGKRRRILVADDNHDAAECLAEALRLMGHEVQTVADGAAAVSLAEADCPDVVLMDLGMPRMDGYEAARRIRSRFGHTVLLVAVSGWGQAEDQRRSRDAGFDRHLVKPVDISDVLALTEALPVRAV